MPLAIDKDSIDKIRTLQGTDAQNIIEMAREIRADISTFFQFEDWSDLDLRNCDLDGASFLGANMNRVAIYQDQLHQIASTNPMSFDQPKIFARPTDHYFHRPNAFSEGLSQLFQPGQTELVKTVDLKLVSEFEKRFTGVYELYRYASQITDVHEQLSAKLEPKENPKLRRAGFQIFPHQGKSKLPTFCLRTEVRKNPESPYKRTVRGTVFLIGEQIFLSGRDADLESHVTLVFEYDKHSTDNLTGIMMMPTNNNRIVTTRVLLLRLPHVKTIDEMSDRIGLIEQVDLPKEISNIPEFLKTTPFVQNEEIVDNKS